jgi:hypothetical protein
MKKFLLLLVAAVLACGLVLSCTQPSAYDITLQPGSAPAVDGTKIVASALTNAILVKWDAAEDSAGSYVYRKEVNADGPIDATLVLRSGSSVYTTTSPKGVPYYFDTGIVNEKKYQYGIASQSYKNASDVVAKSEVVWQEVENNAFAQAKVIALGEVPITLPTYTVEKINSTPLTGTQTQDFAETFLLTFENLEPGITYSFTPAYTTDNNTTTPPGPNWTTGTAIPYTFGTTTTEGTYVDDGNKIVFKTTVTSGGQNGTNANAYQNYSFRVRASYLLPTGSTTTDVVLYPSTAGYYIKTGTPTADLIASTTGVTP